MTRARSSVLVFLAIGMTACAAPAATSRLEDAPDAAAFDVANVQANFAAECLDPIAVDATFCEQVDIEGMTAEGTILIVPTGLNAAATDRARVICELFATVHFDGDTGDDLGYRTIGVRDQDGGNAAACTVSQ